MGGGWVSTFLVIMRNRKKRGHEWHLMKDRNVTVKKIYKVFFCTTAARSKSFKKCFSKKKSVQLICAEKIIKTLSGNLWFSRYLTFGDFTVLKISIKLLINLDRQKIKEILHTVLEIIIPQTIS